jgi:hypothetical protein
LRLWAELDDGLKYGFAKFVGEAKPTGDGAHIPEQSTREQDDHVKEKESV